ncbi:hypothetical protein [Kalamiella sp. sgz302252]|uniref:hypothetical protein n=1 Tax=Pantoea sp. sgz302252 TaxID=3341827 RepID=UPI0036D3305A
MKKEKWRARQLTAGEIKIAESIFKNAINYSRVRVHKESYFPFDLQNKDTAVTPNGEIYFMPKHYESDFSVAPNWKQHWFIHEMAHVWQYQLGLNVKLRGCLSWAANYRYSLPNYKLIFDYGMEAQASLLADYFWLKTFDRSGFESVANFEGIKGPDLLKRYEWVLRGFLSDPSDKRHLP